MSRFYRLCSVCCLLALLFATPPASRGTAGEAASQLPFADDPSGSRSGVADYELQTLKGETLRLSSLRGRVVLLDFFLGQCPHCRTHAPFIAGLAKRYRERGLTVVGLCTNNPFTERETVEEYVKLSGFDAPVAFVPLEVMMSYLKQRPDGSYGVPEAVLFGTDGRLVARFTEWQEKDLPAVERAIEQEIAKKR